MKSKKITKNKWTQEEENYLLEHYKTKPLHKIARKLNRSEIATTARLRTLTNGNIQDKYGGRSSTWWTEEEEQFLLGNPNITAREMAKALDRSIDSVNNKRAVLRNPGREIERKSAEEIKNLEIERDKAAIKAYKRLMNESVDIGRLRLSDVKAKVGQVYIVSRNNTRKKSKNYFKGEVIQVTQRHITLKNKNGIRETFLKADILLKEYEIKEVS